MVESTTVIKRQGVRWRRANLKGLSKDTKRLHDTYQAESDRAKAAGKELRMALNEEWAGHHPDGKNGKKCIFNVINGVVNYAWADMAHLPEEGETLFP